MLTFIIALVLRVEQIKNKRDIKHIKLKFMVHILLVIK
jgi:hypothetical protein